MKLCKKFGLCLLAVAMVLLCFATVSHSALAAAANSYKYEYDGEKAGYYITYVYGDPLTGKVELPGSYNNRPIVGIAHGVFSHEEFTSVTIPYGVVDIDYQAFFHCSELRSITIPSTVTHIGYDAFKECNNLSFNIYDNALYLGDTYNPYHALIRATSQNITSCQIHPNTKVIADRAFYPCKDLVSVTIPYGVQTIGTWAFRECTSLTGVTIPNSVTVIGDEAFYGCTGMTSVTVGSGVNKFGEGVFSGCSGITEATIAEGTTSIGDRAFAGWSSLASIHIPDSVTSIGFGAFQGCYSLNNIVIPHGVTTIEDYTFFGCESLTNITIPGSVTSIGWEAFSYCTSLTHFTIPSSVTTIDYCAFSYCTALTSITVMNSNLTVDQSAFGFCPLERLIFADGVKKVTSAMVICETPEVVIPVSAVSIDDSAFKRGYDLTTVIYCGTQEQWDAIEKGVNNENLTNAPLQFHDYENYMCTLCKKYAEGLREYRLDDYEELAKEPIVYVDGLPYEVQADEDGCYVELPIEAELLLVTYSYHVGDANDIHTQYPTGMKVYLVKGGKITHIPELDDLLQYSGASIRITGKKGIRMITSIEKEKKNDLTGKGLAGYKLLEYGTALCFADEIPAGEDLVLGRSYTRSNYAYKRGVADPVFATTKDLVQYTNVLVGFSLDQCKDDIAMRPYIILEDAQGNQVTLYGGTIYRSIGYIAYQNRTVFKPKTASYNYVWEIIHHVYGDKYDADYKG